jgi:hypothetical protein
MYYKGIYMTTRFGTLFAALLPLFLSCGPLPDPRSLLELDLQPPMLLDVGVPSPTLVQIMFHEPASADPERFAIAPTIDISEVTCTGNDVAVALAAPTSPGVVYRLAGFVRDDHGNGLHFITDLYGFNDRIPELRINEFTTRGSGAHPDLVEIAALGDGNLAGVCLTEGVKDDWKTRMVFPAVEVLTGQFIIVHFKPQGIPEEVNETEDPGQSGGNDVSPGAWDFWVPEGGGLSGNNGAVALYNSPLGDLLDAVVYSNRTSASDNRYRGFGSRRTLEWAESIHSAGGWAAAGDLIAPEDAVNPDGSTATRSLCRSSSSDDTDTAADWHIVPTRGSTFGEVNSDAVHD